MKGKVYFVGAGPGDPELITLKGMRLLRQADVVIYAGSLVNHAIVEGLDARLMDSSGMTLEDIVDNMVRGVEEGRLVVRLHTGDTAFYSAISEQIERLRQLDIGYEVVPGVTSAGAAAAALGQELTIPGVSQSVIFTRLEGRTPVPPLEHLGLLASHQTTMVIFLSVSMTDRVKEELLKGYPGHTPVVIVERASWPTQRIIRGTLNEMDEMVKRGDIKKTALILVGQAFEASNLPTGKRSLLYDGRFSHGYRQGV